MVSRSGAPRLASPLRAAVLLIALSITMLSLGAQQMPTPAPGTRTTPTGRGASEETAEIQLLVGRSAVLNLPNAISRVSLTSPDVADAVVTTPQQVLVHGKAPGTISMFLWDRSGSIKTYEVVVQRDLSRLQEQLHQLFPGEALSAVSNGKHVVISGSVSSKYVVDKAADVAAGYVDKKEDVVNLIQQREVGATQIMLRVRFAEVTRNALSQLGTSFFTQLVGYKDWVGRTTTQQFPAPDFDPGGQIKGLAFSDYLNVFLFNTDKGLGGLVKALQSRGLFQSLAEPNLIAENGKEASFLAGGEYPYPAVQGAGQNVAITIVFKEFGIRLSFTPTVLGSDLIHLKVRPEVSSLDFSNAVILQGFRVPSLLTRRAQTEVQVRDGQTFAIAGLLNNNLTKTMQKIPGIGDVPILGLLFRSRALDKSQTELVVMITPHILRPGSPGVATEVPKGEDTFLKPIRNPKPMPPPPPGGSEPEASTRPESTARPSASTQPQRTVEPAVVATPLIPPTSSSARSQSASDVKKVERKMRKQAEEQSRKDRAAQKEQAEIDRRVAKANEELRKREERIAREQALEAKKTAESQKKQAQVVAAAEQKVKDAQAAYQAELERLKKEREKQPQ